MIVCKIAGLPGLSIGIACGKRFAAENWTMRDRKALDLPPSATRQWISITGLAVLLLALFTLKSHPPSDPIVVMIAMIAAIALPILALEELMGMRPRVPARVRADPERFQRVFIKLTGLLATYAVIALAYWSFPIYRGGEASIFLAILRYLFVPLVVVTPIYVWLTDRRMQQPHDGCYMAGLAALGYWRKLDREKLHQYALGWVVKAFFAPLMFDGASEDLVWFLNVDIMQALNETKLAWYEFNVRMLYFVETFWAGAGYLLTLRLFNSEIRSTEPTAYGCLVCIVCYMPFWPLFEHNYLDYEIENYQWTNWLVDWPIFAQVWAGGLFLLTAIYAYSTIAFGVRFSNLTHRGIITNGTYRWSKHPAYLSKNLSWWFISIPFLNPAGPAEALRLCLLLAGLNLIYYMRAKTEERHLSRDPVYRAYAAWIDEHGLIARAKRLLWMLARAFVPSK